MECYRSELWRVLRSDLSFHVVSANLSERNTEGDDLFLIFPFSCGVSPDGLTEAFLCGGVPPNVNSPEAVYARTYGVYKKILRGIFAV